MPALGDRKPSDLMAEMTEKSPPGILNNVFFGTLFLRKLPEDLRIHLADFDFLDHNGLAEKADRLWSHRPKGVNAIAEEEDGDIAAVRGGGTWKQQGKKKTSQPAARAQGGPRKPPGQPVAAGGTGPRRNTPGDHARLATGLCRAHWGYGEQAYACGEPATCKWTGN